MSKEMAQIKYPSERRPTEIYTNDSGSVNVAFNLTTNRSTEDKLEETFNSLRSTFQQLYKNAEWKNDGIVEIGNKKVGYMELVTNAADTKIYNRIWVCVMEDKLLLATFNCTNEQMNEWEPISEKIMKSMDIQ
jgi:hypothetical protein